MFSDDLWKAISKNEPLLSILDIEATALPKWDDLIPFFDNSYINGNTRARDPHKIFCDVKRSDFPFVRDVVTTLAKKVGRKPEEISCHSYAGFTPNAIASPPHQDKSNVLFICIAGKIPWKIFADGCDYDDKTQTMTSKSTHSTLLFPRSYAYIPAGVYHAAYPNQSRCGFSFGWS